MSYTKVSKPFSHWLANLDELDGWLYIAEQEIKLSQETSCHCIYISDELSPAERDEARSKGENELAKSGLTRAFDRAEIEMVVANLVQQSPTFTQEKCLEALTYYWENDAYIAL